MFSIMLAGDAMLGRGIDQILPHPCDPAIPDPRSRSATYFVDAAERRNGPIPRRVDPAYVWGDALPFLEAERPAVRILNLETAVTTAPDFAAKPITYRMNPANVGTLQAFGVDCCVLANNHVLDWGEAGLVETLETLDRAGMACVGAGRDEREAWSPRLLPHPDGGRVIVLAMADTSCGAPASWAARRDKPGVALMEHSIDACVEQAARAILPIRTEGDIVVASVHWGPNWGYDLGSGQVEFARKLIDRAGVNVVHGHSSHHPRQMAVHGGGLILFGCGDLINDYEGLPPPGGFRNDLVAIYVLTVDRGAITKVRIQPYRIRRFRLERASAEDTAWLAAQVNRRSAGLGTAFVPDGETGLRLARSP